MADIVKRLGYGQSGGSSTAAGISYDNDDSGLLADNVQDAIDEVVVDLNEETGRATAAEQAVDARVDNEIVARQMADAALQSDIDGEIARAIAAEGTLQSNIDGVAADLVTETSNRIAGDALLQGEIDAVETDLTALDTRLGVAEGEINTLQTDVVTAQNAADDAQADATQALTDAATAQTSADNARQSIDDHIADTTGAHAASAISNTPAGTISATDLQSAVNELDSAIVDAQADASQALSDAAAAQADATQAQSEVDALELLVSDNTADISALDTRIDAIEPFISAGDISEQSFSITNNTSTPANITNFTFTSRSFTANISVTISATSSLYSEYIVRGIQKGSSWVISYSGTGDDTGVFFDITNAGQITYICSNYAGFVSGTIKFRAITLGV